MRSLVDADHLVGDAPSGQGHRTFGNLLVGAGDAVDVGQPDVVERRPKAVYVLGGGQVVADHDLAVLQVVYDAFVGQLLLEEAALGPPGPVVTGGSRDAVVLDGLGFSNVVLGQHDVMLNPNAVNVGVGGALITTAAETTDADETADAKTGNHQDGDDGGGDDVQQTISSGSGTGGCAGGAGAPVGNYRTAASPTAS